MRTPDAGFDFYDKEANGICPTCGNELYDDDESTARQKRSASGLRCERCILGVATHEILLEYLAMKEETAGTTSIEDYVDWLMKNH